MTETPEAARRARLIREYRELLADKIAEAIVEQRYGEGVYHVQAQAYVPPPGQGQRPGLAPETLRTR